MKPLEMQTAGIRLYGRKHWKLRLSRDLGVDVSTIHRIMKREQVPPVYDVALLGLIEHKKRADEIEAAARKLRRPVLKRRKTPRQFRKKEKTDADTGIES